MYNTLSQREKKKSGLNVQKVAPQGFIVYTSKDVFMLNFRRQNQPFEMMFQKFRTLFLGILFMLGFFKFMTILCCMRI